MGGGGIAFKILVLKCNEEYYDFCNNSKRRYISEEKERKDELLKQNEEFLLKYVTRGENQKKIPPRSDDALNQNAESEISMKVKDVNRDDGKLQVAQIECKVQQNPESQSTHSMIRMKRRTI